MKTTSISNSFTNTLTKPLTTILILLISVLMFSGLGASETFTVDADFDGNSPEANNYTSIQDAVNAANEGESDTIEVAPGEYEGVSINVGNVAINGPNADIAGYADRSREASIDGTVSIEAQDVTIRGMEIDSPDNGKPSVDLVDVKGLVLENSSILGDPADGAISAWTGPAEVEEHVRIAGNDINNGPIGLYTKSADVEIIDNNISGAADEGIWAATPSGSDFQIEGNTITDSGKQDLKMVEEPGSISQTDDLSDLSAVASDILEENEASTVKLWNGQVYNQEGHIVVSDGELIQNAVDAASEGDTIEVASGTYDEELALDVSNLKLVSEEEHEATINLQNDGELGIAEDGVVVEGFVLDGNDGERVIAPQDSSNVEIRNNVLQNSYRGVQGDYYGRPGSLTMEGNTFQTDYGIASTEDISSLKIDSNTFETSVEGIGLGEGAGLVNDEEEEETASEVLSDNTWNLEDGYAIKEYRDEGDVYVTEGGSIQAAVDAASEGDAVKVAEGEYDEGGVMINTPNLELVSINGPDSTKIEGGTNVVAIDANNVTVEGFNITGGNTGIQVKHDVRLASVSDNVFKNDDGMMAAYFNRGSNGTVESNNVSSVRKGVGMHTDGEVKVLNNKFLGVEPSLEVFDDQNSEGSIDHTVRNNDFVNSNVQVGESATLDAEHNYWGQAEGPSEDQISGELSYRPWLLNDPTEGEVTEYDQTVAFKHGWTAFSFPENVEDLTVAGEDRFLNYSGTWSSTEISEMETSSLGAYFGHEDAKAIGYNFAGEGSSSREVVDGWNFVGAFDHDGENTGFGSVFSTIRSATDSVSFAEENVEALTSEDQVGTGLNYFGAVKNQQTSEYGGYWIKASGERTLETSTPNQPNPEEDEG